LIRVALSVEGRDERCQFDTIGFECGLVEGHRPVDVVWVRAIVSRRERPFFRFVRIGE
jgi:uncharacterized Zn finger protein